MCTKGEKSVHSLPQNLFKLFFIINFAQNNNAMDSELKKAKDRIEELEMRLRSVERELRLTKLRRQVTPHFLFNSISVAVSLVAQSPKTSVRFLRHLAEMYRYLLKYGNEYYVPIEQEVVMMSQFYELMCLRHVGSIRLNLAPEVKRLKSHPLPPLALQGLLENAIKHNVHTEEQPLVVNIYQDGDYLCISNKIVPLLSDRESSHLGLAYMNETMLLLFNREISIINDGVTFTVKVPLL